MGKGKTYDMEIPMSRQGWTLPEQEGKAREIGGVYRIWHKNLPITELEADQIMIGETIEQKKKDALKTSKAIFKVRDWDRVEERWFRAWICKSLGKWNFTIVAQIIQTSEDGKKFLVDCGMPEKHELPKDPQGKVTQEACELYAVNLMSLNPRTDLLLRRFAASKIPPISCVHIPKPDEEDKKKLKEMQKKAFDNLESSEESGAEDEEVGMPMALMDQEQDLYQEQDGDDPMDVVDEEVASPPRPAAGRAKNIAEKANRSRTDRRNYQPAARGASQQVDQEALSQASQCLFKFEKAGPKGKKTLKQTVKNETLLPPEKETLLPPATTNSAGPTSMKKVPAPAPPAPKDETVEEEEIIDNATINIAAQAAGYYLPSMTLLQKIPVLQELGLTENQINEYFQAEARARASSTVLPGLAGRQTGSTSTSATNSVPETNVKFGAANAVTGGTGLGPKPKVVVAADGTITTVDKKPPKNQKGVGKGAKAKNLPKPAVSSGTVIALPAGSLDSQAALATNLEQEMEKLGDEELADPKGLNSEFLKTLASDPSLLKQFQAEMEARKQEEKQTVGGEGATLVGEGVETKDEVGGQEGGEGGSDDDIQAASDDENQENVEEQAGEEGAAVEEEQQVGGEKEQANGPPEDELM